VHPTVHVIRMKSWVIHFEKSASDLVSPIVDFFQEAPLIINGNGAFLYAQFSSIQEYLPGKECLIEGNIIFLPLWGDIKGADAGIKTTSAYLLFPRKPGKLGPFVSHGNSAR
jgi:hypothetical protein